MIKNLMVSKSELRLIESNMKIEKLKSTIEEYDYDYIPIRSDHITHYYLKSTNEKHKIEFENTVDINTSIKPLLKKLSKKDPLFVTDNGEVVGIISVSDLNSKDFSLWLFKYFVDIEKDLSKYIVEKIPTSEIIIYMNNSKKDSYDRYLMDLEKNVNNEPIEYLYFSDLLKIIQKHKLYEIFDCESKSQFKKFHTLNELRNSIMHASKSLVKEKSDVIKLLKRIEKMEMIQFYLKSRENIN